MTILAQVLKDFIVCSCTDIIKEFYSLLGEQMHFKTLISFTHLICAFASLTLQKLRQLEKLFS
jgi:hypothetical protein